MLVPNQRQALQRVASLLTELLAATGSEAAIRRDRLAPEADGVIEVAGYVFVVEWRGSGATASVSTAVEEVRRCAARLGRHAIPLIAVPFMGSVGRRRCEQADIAWLDLSGNARIMARGMRVRVDGQPNRFKRRGRPLSAFAPKSARIARWLLMHPHTPMAQREIAKATGMDEGFTSRIVSRLEQDELIVREPDGAIRPRDPDLLLDAWREDYDFSKHQILRGHVPARSGSESLRHLAGVLRGQGMMHAATGLAAVWLLTRFVGFRLVTMYVVEFPTPELLEDLGFREDEGGANVWLVVPRDDGVLQGVADRDGVACVDPVQAYLDLKGLPERAKEAADRLRAELLTWSPDA